MLGKSWTEEEDKLFREQYATTPTSELEKTLNRSRDSVYSHAKKLKLYKRRSYLFTGGKFDLAYLAGIIDGEGCIGIQKRPHHCLRIRVSNVDFELIDWLHTTFGGAVSNTIHKKGNRRPQKTWRVRAWEATELLKRVFPFLIVKRKQAELALEFQKRIAWPYKGGTNNLSDKEMAIREQYRQKMKMLNKRGKQR